MPLGRYRVTDGRGTPAGTEDFRCASGPMGWRYFSRIRADDPARPDATVDIVVDAAWRPVRARIEIGEHSILVTAEPTRLVGFLDREPIEIPWGHGNELAHASPGFDAVTLCHREDAAEFDVVVLDALDCEPRVERRRAVPASGDAVETPVGRFIARRWRYEDLTGGTVRDLWCAGDVVVHEEGRCVLETYDPGVSGPAPIS